MLVNITIIKRILEGEKKKKKSLVWESKNTQFITSSSRNTHFISSCDGEALCGAELAAILY